MNEKQETKEEMIKQDKFIAHKSTHGFTVDDYMTTNRNHPVTNELLELFLKNHRIEVLSQGLKMMKYAFEKVPSEDREGVFAGFLLELQSRGFNYLASQFQNNEKEKEVFIG